MFLISQDTQSIHIRNHGDVNKPLAYTGSLENNHSIHRIWVLTICLIIIDELGFQ